MGGSFSSPREQLVPELVNGTASSSTGSNSAVTRFLLITANEGKVPVRLDSLRHALAAAFNSTCRQAETEPGAVHGVVVACQEKHQDSGALWDEALRSFGFSNVAVDFRQNDVWQSLAIYMRADGSVKVLDTFRTRPTYDKGREHKKGAAVAIVETASGIRICFGSFHADGNVADQAERTAQLSSAVLRGCRRVGRVDIALLAGDVNCALQPPFNGNVDGNDVMNLLADEIRGASELQAVDAVCGLGEKARAVLQSRLATRDGRTALQRYDSSPVVLRVDPDLLRHDRYAEAEQDISGVDDVKRHYISRLHLADMLPGSFPTYRCCNREGRAFEALDLCGDAHVSESVRLLAPSMDVSTDCVQNLYFDSEDGKAGAIKKRGDMIRLQLGWMDRLYWGALDESRGVRIWPGDPLAIQSECGTMSRDHLMVPWLVSV